MILFFLSDSHKRKDKYKDKEHKHKDHKKDKEKSKHGNRYVLSDLSSIYISACLCV